MRESFVDRTNHDIVGENKSIEEPTLEIDSTEEFEDAQNEVQSVYKDNVHEVQPNRYNLRPRKQNVINCAYLADIEEPQNYEEAKNCNLRLQWKQAMDE